MSDIPIFWLLLLQLVFISFNAIFACAELAVISINDNKLAKLTLEGDKRAVRLTKLVRHPEGFLATIQVGITLMNLLSSAVATENFSDKLVLWLAGLGLNIPKPVVGVLSVVVITILLTYFTVLLGELIPKRLAMKKAEQIALAMSGLIYVLSKLFAPAVWLFSVSTNGFLRLVGMDPHGEEEINAEEEIRMMLDLGKDKGKILPDEYTMIKNVFEFNDICAVEIMTHRTEVVFLDTDDGDEEWNKTIYDSKHSVYPVCAETPDNIVGILYAKEYYRIKNRLREEVLQKAVHPAFFVPETVRADTLFRKMQRSRNYFAVVVDEYGGMSGIITMNDLLEQLVGALENDHFMPAEKPEIERVNETTWLIQGATPLDEIATQLGVPLPEDDFDTLGGLVFGVLGIVPDDGSTPEVEINGLKIKATMIKDRRLISATVQLMEQESE